MMEEGLEERLGVAEWTSVHAETPARGFGAAFSSISYIKLEVGGRTSRLLSLSLQTLASLLALASASPVGRNLGWDWGLDASSSSGRCRKRKHSQSALPCLCGACVLSKHKTNRNSLVSSLSSQKELMTSSPLSKKRGNRHLKDSLFKNLWVGGTGKKP